MTRRARKNSVLSAVVLKWSRARKRYERQGVLVESEAAENAEQECQAESATPKPAMTISWRKAATAWMPGKTCAAPSPPSSPNGDRFFEKPGSTTP
jgi:hypothetical protein